MARFIASFKLCLLGTLVILIMAGATIAQTQVTAGISWAEPANGTKAVEYIVQISTESGPWKTVMTVTEPRANLSLSDNESHRVRVAGVDAEGVEGPFSVPSEAYNPSTNLVPAPNPTQPELTNP